MANHSIEELREVKSILTDGVWALKLTYAYERIWVNEENKLIKVEKFDFRANRWGLALIYRDKDTKS
jgi:hypothetical protein